jgi:putative DeoR family transcriptional regulator (stage III sporulation protein D)
VKKLREYNLYRLQIEERVVAVATYMIKNNATVRQAASKFGVSKSTIHKDVTERLGVINPVLAGEVRSILDVNKSERHIRGGLATKEKYLVNRQKELKMGPKTY